MLSAEGFATLAGFLKARSGLSLGPEKLYLLESRLKPVLRRHDIADLATLAEQMRRGQSEPVARAVIEAMTTNETFFFRDRQAFTHFTSVAVPRFLATGRAGPMRIWSAACSTGQEPWSIAMALREPGVKMPDVAILATDLNTAALARAEAGLYSEFEMARGLALPLRDRFFTPADGQWRVAAALRPGLRFAPWNLLDDPRPHGQFDVVFLRNVLIYFDLPTRARVLETIAGVMAPQGVLYLGGAETAVNVTARLQPIAGVRGAYRRS